MLIGKLVIGMAISGLNAPAMEVCSVYICQGQAELQKPPTNSKPGFEKGFGQKMRNVLVEPVDSPIVPRYLSAGKVGINL